MYDEFDKGKSRAGSKLVEKSSKISKKLQRPKKVVQTIDLEEHLPSGSLWTKF